MTRDPNGDIGMWETSMGTCVTLLERWQGVQLSAAERAVHAAATAKIEKGQKKGLLGGILSKKSKKGKEGEGLLSGEGGAEGADALIPLEEDSGDPNSMDALMDLDKSGGRDAHLLSTAEEMMLEHAPATVRAAGCSQRSHGGRGCNRSWRGRSGTISLWP